MKNLVVLNQDILSGLLIVSQKLQEQNIRWVIGTSCGLALHGIDIKPNDIDIITDDDGAIKITNLLEEYKVEILKGPTEVFNSTLRCFLIDNCTIEVMGHFRIKSGIDHEWHDMSYLLNDPTIINIQGFNVPVVSLLKLLEMYKIMDRDKDFDKIQKIESYIKQMEN